jgi:hypothetical protein
MNDQELSEILRSLPKEKAGEDFTARLLTRLDAAPPTSSAWSLQRWPRHRLVLAASLCLILFGGIFGARHWQRVEARREALAELAELRGEQRALERELAELVALTRSDPVVYLGGSEEVDVVIDLGNLARRQQGSARPARLSSPSNLQTPATWPQRR